MKAKLLLCPITLVLVSCWVTLAIASGPIDTEDRYFNRQKDPLTILDNGHHKESLVRKRFAEDCMGEEGVKVQCKRFFVEKQRVKRIEDEDEKYENNDDDIDDALSDSVSTPLDQKSKTKGHSGDGVKPMKLPQPQSPLKVITSTSVKPGHNIVGVPLLGTNDDDPSSKLLKVYQAVRSHARARQKAQLAELAQSKAKELKPIHMYGSTPFHAFLDKIRQMNVPPDSEKQRQFIFPGHLNLDQLRERPAIDRFLDVMPGANNPLLPNRALGDSIPPPLGGGLPPPLGGSLPPPLPLMDENPLAARSNPALLSLPPPALPGNRPLDFNIVSQPQSLPLPISPQASMLSRLQMMRGLPYTSAYDLGSQQLDPYSALMLMKAQSKRSHRHRAHARKAKCSPNPCENGGVCTALRSGFECACALGFKGKHCSERNQCLPNPCKNGGNCYDKGSGYECVCVRGFTGSNCEEVNQCVPDPCHNGGRCTNTRDGYHCECSGTFKGRMCEEVDHCGLINPCQNGATCYNKEDGYQCNCRTGYRGENCEDRDMCHSGPCMNGGNCVNTAYGHFLCRCNIGYKGENCEVKMTKCELQPCLNGGTCVETGQETYTCLCPEFYTGINCEEMRSHCDSQPCMHGAQCIDTLGGYRCDCHYGYHGKNCEGEPAVPKSQCQSCSEFAVCRKGECQCKEDYEGDGHHCEAISKCHPNPCYNGGTCMENPTGFLCECTDEYTGPICKDLRPCVQRPCLNGGSCVDIDGRNFHCDCTNGFHGQTCEIPDPCHPNPCQNDGSCYTEMNLPRCQCTKKYEGAFCEVDKCSKCDIHARCEGGFCVCEDGFEGEGTTGTCFKKGGAAPTRFCMPSPCKNGGICAEKVDGFECHCPVGFVGLDCAISTEGLSPPSVPKTVLKDPCEPNPCRNGGTCSKNGDLYSCKCSVGYTGGVCDIEIAYCHPNPCMNGGTCIQHHDGYQCRCSGGFFGSNCQDDDCGHCDEHAICINGQCKCRIGYQGDGFECVKKEKKCRHCSRHAKCIEDTCICNDGYTGDGVYCKRDPCKGCPDNSKCQQGVCVCSKGFYFDGSHCVAPPATTVSPPQRASLVQSPSSSSSASLPARPMFIPGPSPTVHCQPFCFLKCFRYCPQQCCTYSPPRIGKKKKRKKDEIKNTD